MVSRRARSQLANGGAGRRHVCVAIEEIYAFQGHLCFGQTKSTCFFYLIFYNLLRQVYGFTTVRTVNQGTRHGGARTDGRDGKASPRFLCSSDKRSLLLLLLMVYENSDTGYQFVALIDLISFLGFRVGS